MRNCSYLVIVLSILMCLSCSNDDDTTVNMPIVGCWQSVSSHQLYVNRETRESFVTEDKPDVSMYMEFYNNGKCKYASNSIISNYTIVDSILHINGSGEVGNKENHMTIIVRGDFIIEELSNDRMVLKENGYDLIYEQNRYGEPKVWYETHGIFTLKKESDK